MAVISSKFASWIAICALLISSVLTLTHFHASQDCGCSSDDHAHPSATALAGLENLPRGDCDCSGCEIPNRPEQQDDIPNDHDEDSCSICRMVYEHATESVEYVPTESNEPVFDIVVFLDTTIDLHAVSGYFTRGPPSLLS